MPRSINQLNRTRATLLQRLVHLDDRVSWQEFFDVYWKLIYSVARQAGMSDAEAQDVVQETMLSVAKHMPTFKYDPALGSFKAWLLNLTRWRVIDQMRKRGPQTVHRADTSGDTATVEKVIDPASDALEEVWELEWEETLLEAAMSKLKRRLDPRKYQIFDLYVNKHWPPEKIASSFGIAVEQIYLAKHRVIEMLKIEIDRLRKDVI